MCVVHVEQVLEPHAEVVEAASSGVVLHDVAAVHGEREPRRDELVVLESKGVDALIASVARHALMAEFEVGFVADTGVVDGECGGKYAVTRNGVRMRRARPEQQRAADCGADSAE